MSTNIIMNLCHQCNAELTPYHWLLHLPPYTYIFATLIVILVFILISKHAKEFTLETALGKIKIPFIKDDNKVDMCELCRINVASLVANIAEISNRINRTQQTSINEQLRELDNQFIIDSSWINNCHARMVSEKIREKGINNDEEKAKIFLKNSQILNFIWLIKKQNIFDYIKNIIMINHFIDKNTTELRYFVAEKSRLLLATIENGPNLFPDWDDSDLLFGRDEYVQIMIERVKDRLEDSMRQLLERCQIIQRKYNKEIEGIEEEKIKFVENFKKSLPPKKQNS